MSVKEVKFHNLRDIPQRLRELADWAERNPGEVQTVLVISAANDKIIAVHGYGERTSPLEAQGWITMAALYVGYDRTPALAGNPKDSA